MSVNMSCDQRVLLEKINQYSEPNRRTDKLAVCMQQFGKQWDNSHTAFVGLQLRALGWVTTFKDTSQYAQWNITPTGKAALLELKNMAKPAPVPPAKPVQWAVFSECDSGFQRCVSKEAAEALARKWVVESDEDAVHIIQIVKTLKAKVVVEEVWAS